jgi:hypothetical protein
LGRLLRARIARKWTKVQSLLNLGWLVVKPDAPGWPSSSPEVSSYPEGPTLSFWPQKATSTSSNIVCHLKFSSICWTIFWPLGSHIATGLLASSLRVFKPSFEASISRSDEFCGEKLCFVL